MQPINFSQDLKNDLTQALRTAVYKFNLYKNRKKKWQEALRLDLIIQRNRYLLTLIDHSVKYILPKNGELLEDPGLTFLSGKPILLPHAYMLFEIPFEDTPDQKITKLVIMVSDEEEYIGINFLPYYIKKPAWDIMDTVSIHKNFIIMKDTTTGPMLNGVRFPKFMDHQVAAGIITTTLGILNALASTRPKIVTKKRAITDSRNLKNPSKIPSSDSEEYRYVYMDLPKSVPVKSETEESCRRLLDERYRPHEYKRKAHERRYKSGKIVQIPEVIVNEGIGYRAEKKYIVRGPKQLTKHIGA